MSCLDVLIKYYHLSLYPRLRVPVPPSCVHRDNGTLPFLKKLILLFSKGALGDQKYQRTLLQFYVTPVE